MGKNYYFLTASLPELAFDLEAKTISIESLKLEIQEAITPSDWKRMSEIFRQYDVANILYLKGIDGSRFSELGNYSEEEMNLALENISILPTFIRDFLKEPISSEDDNVIPYTEIETLKPEMLLWTNFYSAMQKKNNSFIRNWYSFDRDFRNILTAITCRKQKIEIAPHLIGTGALVELLAHSSASDFGVHQEIDYIDRLIHIAEIPNLLEREKKFDLLRWEKAEEIAVYDYFNVNSLMAFLIKALIVHRWISLDRTYGETLFQNLVSELKNSFDLTDSFKVQ
ncbi:DUF2764 family protein [Williamwhitmania taraxaci]|uniref:DUF2764 domain-containing protein n=1 Tax=Williamwhitmania taraxaci TaxID=1640674 RepID=A0A1G6HVX9_9BACT|nr:DUF2764 family protein [Williamwhitmania taraxaci]SDB98381.1 Protein of unknown function [Williamwhitmania taraxaci]